MVAFNSNQNKCHQQYEAARLRRQKNIEEQLASERRAKAKKIRRIEKNYRGVCRCRVAQLQLVFEKMEKDEIQYKIQRAEVLRGEYREELELQQTILTLVLAISSPFWLLALLLHHVCSRYANLHF